MPMSIDWKHFAKQIADKQRFVLISHVRPDADALGSELGMAGDRNENNAGIRVQDVMPGGPAEQGGLKVGDLVTSINGAATQTMDAFARALTGQGPGAQVKMQVQRAGQPVDVTVTLGRRPMMPATGPEGAPAGPTAPDARPLLGLRLASLTAELQARLRVPAPVGTPPGGAVVVGVMQGSAADRAGVPMEAVIVSINGKPVLNAADVTKIITEAGPGAEVTLDFYSNGELMERKVTLDTPAAPPSLPPTSLPSPPAVETQGSNSARIEMLERRVQQLEQRILQLEATVQAIPKPRDTK